MTKTQPPFIDIHEVFAERHQIAIVWCVEDVFTVRPDLSEESAWEVLEVCQCSHDANVGISWDVIRCVAKELFGEREGEDNE